MIPAYVSAMGVPALWSEIQPLLVKHLPSCPHAFSLVMSLVRAAVEAGVAESAWAGFLRAASQTRTAFDLVSRHHGSSGERFLPDFHSVGWAMHVPEVWRGSGVYDWVARILDENHDDSMFALGLRLVLTAIDKNDVDEPDWIKLLDVLSAKKQFQLRDPCPRDRDDDCARNQLAEAIRVPRVWEVIFPVVRSTVAQAARSDGENNAFQQCLDLVLSLSNASQHNPSAWEPLLDGLSSVPLWPAALQFTPGRGYYGAPQLAIQPTLTSVMSHTKRSIIWPVIWSQLISALGQCDNSFDVGFTLICDWAFPGRESNCGYYAYSRQQDAKPSSSDWLDEQVKQAEQPPWVDLVPATFSAVPTPSQQVMQSQDAQEKLWLILVRTQHVPSIQHVVAAYCTGGLANGVQLLQTPVRVLLNLKQLPDLPGDVVRAVAPMIQLYIEQMAAAEVKRNEEAVTAAPGLHDWDVRNLRSKQQQFAEDVSMWERVQERNVGARLADAAVDVQLSVLNPH